ncbi:hypothetical protein ACFXTN_041444 [Malus domestica]
MRNTEFIVALNKVDRLYGWKTCRNAPIVKAMKKQSKDVQNKSNMKLATSAAGGEGIPDLLLLLLQWTLKTMVEKLTFSSKMVKVTEGHGTTIGIVLVNGVLHEGDQIVVCGMQGPIVTTIRALLTPHSMKELHVKGNPNFLALARSCGIYDFLIDFLPILTLMLIPSFAPNLAEHSVEKECALYGPIVCHGSGVFSDLNHIALQIERARRMSPVKFSLDKHDCILKLVISGGLYISACAAQLDLAVWLVRLGPGEFAACYG